MSLGVICRIVQCVVEPGSLSGNAISDGSETLLAATILRRRNIIAL